MSKNLANAWLAHDAGAEQEMYMWLFHWVQTLPIYSCDDLGLCNGPSEKHDCVDCPSKRC